jgi:hypothetical protein
MFKERPPFYECTSWWTNTTLFYNQTVRMHYTPRSTAIRSYLAVEEETLAEKLQQVLDSDIVAPFISDPNRNVDIRRLLNLFSNITVTERKFGFMLQGGYTHNHVSFRAYTPLYWIERNFFLTNEELRLIEAEFGEADPYEQKQFQDRFLIADKLGFGDTRVELLLHVIPPHSPTAVDVGLSGIIPTAFSLLKGLRGHNFEPKERQMPFNFNNIYDKISVLLNVKNETTKDQIVADILGYVRCFGEDALDRLAGTLLSAPLGYGGHGGFGFIIRTHTDWGRLTNKRWLEDLISTTRFSLEYFCPAVELRTYAKQPDLQQFAARDFNDDAQAQSNLDFLQQELVNRVQPISIPVDVQPGLLLQITNHLAYTFNKNWRVIFGSDWWVQGQETIDAVYASPFIREDIDVNKARKPFAYQGTTHGGIEYRWASEKSGAEWNITVYVESVGFNSGIGQSGTLGLSLDFSQ